MPLPRRAEPDGFDRGCLLLLSLLEEEATSSNVRGTREEQGASERASERAFSSPFFLFLFSRAPSSSHVPPSLLPHLFFSVPSPPALPPQASAPLIDSCPSLYLRYLSCASAIDAAALLEGQPRRARAAAAAAGAAAARALELRAWMVLPCSFSSSFFFVLTGWRSPRAGPLSARLTRESEREREGE